MTEEDILIQVSYERNRSIDFIRELRHQLQEDKNLLMNVKRDNEAIGDSTLFNVHRNLMARSFSAKPSVSFKKTKEGIEREIKMLNACLKEDFNTADMKALKYYKDWNKFWAGFSFTLRNGWDGIYKKNKWELINPMNVVMDPMGDYFSWGYKFIGFDRIITRQQLEEEGYENIDDLTSGESMQDWAMRWKRETQEEKDLLPQNNMDEYEVYLHFDTFNGKKGFVMVANNGTQIIKAGLIKPGDSVQAKNPSAICFPVVAHFWNPIPDIPCGDRPANYARDVQITQSKLANLRLKKAQAELYPMYLYNKDYVSGKDLSFGFNKGIPVSTGIDGPQVNLSNIVSPIQKDLRIDTTMAIEQSLNNQLEKSLGIGSIAGGSTPDRRETAKTNSLIMDSLDILISLTEEVDLIGEEQMVRQWFYGYYENFTDADTKLVFAASGTQTLPIDLKREDFIIDGNLSIDIESSTETESKKNKARVNFANYYAFIQNNPEISSISKLVALREFGSYSDVPSDIVDSIIAKTPQEMLQEMENESLKKNIPVDIQETDDHLTHLLTMGDNILTEAQIVHKMAHMEAYIATPQQQPWGDAQIASQAMAQLGAEATSLNQ